MTYYDDGRSWLSLVQAKLGDASRSVIECLRRTDAAAGLAQYQAKDTIAALDEARICAMRALVYFELAADDQRKGDP